MLKKSHVSYPNTLFEKKEHKTSRSCSGQRELWDNAGKHWHGGTGSLPALFREPSQPKAFLIFLEGLRSLEWHQIPKMRNAKLRIEGEQARCSVLGLLLSP